MILFKKTKAIHVFAIITTMFFFLGWVVFENYRTIFFGFQINPFIVTGFGFAFISIMIQYNEPVKKYVNRFFG